MNTQVKKKGINSVCEITGMLMLQYMKIFLSIIYGIIFIAINREYSLHGCRLIKIKDRINHTH